MSYVPAIMGYLTLFACSENKREQGRAKNHRVDSSHTLNHAQTAACSSLCDCVDERVYVVPEPGNGCSMALAYAEFCCGHSLG